MRISDDEDIYRENQIRKGGGGGGEKRLKSNKSEWPSSINKIQKCPRRSENTSIHVYGRVPQAEIIESKESEAY